MATHNNAYIANETDTVIRSGMSDTAASDLRALIKDILDSYINVVDGGLIQQSQFGYSTIPTYTDQKAIVHKGYVDIGLSNMVPLSGTTVSNYLTGRIGYEPSVDNTTALSSGTRKIFAIGSGENIDLVGAATDYGYVYFNPVFDSGYGNRISLEASDSNIGNANLSFIVGSRKTEILANFSGYAGLQYETNTATKVTANQTSLSVLHRAANDLRYLSITTASSTYMPKAGGTFTGAITLSADAISNLQPVTLQQAIAMLSGYEQLQTAYNASSNLFPTASNTSPVVAAIKKGMSWYVSVAGTLGGVAVAQGDEIIALIDAPGQTSTNWLLISHTLGYMPVSNVLASGNIFVGNASNIATGLTLTLNSSSGTFGLSNTGVLTFQDSSTSTRGLLNSTDWNVFNNKLSTSTASSTYVPYTGANAAINLGSQLLNTTGLVNFGNATTTSQRQLRVGQDTAFIDFGSLTTTTTFAAIYINQSTPGGNNYAILGSSSNTFINGSSGVNLQIGGSTRFGLDSSGNINATPVAVTSGLSTSFKFVIPNNTGQTASTAVSGWLIPTFSRTWANGAASTTIATQIEYDYQQATYNTSGGGTLVFTNIYAHRFYSAALGTSVTATNNYAMGINGHVDLTGYRMYFGQTAIDATNYALTGTQFSTNLNSSGTLTLKISATDIVNVQAGMLLLTPQSQATGAVTPFTFTAPNNTGQTASTNIPKFLFTTGQTTFANGAITLQESIRMTAPVYAHASGTNTITDAGTLNVYAATTTGGFTTITNNWAIISNGSINVVGMVQSSTGFFSNAVSSLAQINGFTNNLGLFGKLSNGKVIIGYNAGTAVLTIDSTGANLSVGNLMISTVGNGIQIKEGTNGRMNEATLVSGTITIANTSVTANTRVFMTRRTTGASVGNLTYTVIAGTSFTINSDSPLDTGIVEWILIEKL